MAADAGFSGVELLPVTDAAERVAVREAMAATGVRVSSIEAGSAGGAALLDREGDELKANIELAETAVRNAAEWGASTVLVVPGRVDADTSAEASWSRAAEVLGTWLVPLAEELGVTLGIENTWHGYLLTAHEHARFVDELGSPAVGAYFDPGNVVFGNPEHWVPVLGERIVGVHYKDFSMRTEAEIRVLRFAMAGSGDIDWLAVDLALDAVGYTGWLTHPAVPPPLPVKLLQRLDETIAPRSSALEGPLARLQARRVRELGQRARACDAALGAC